MGVDDKTGCETGESRALFPGAVTSIAGRKYFQNKIIFQCNISQALNAQHQLTQ